MLHIIDWDSRACSCQVQEGAMSCIDTWMPGSPDSAYFLEQDVRRFSYIDFWVNIIISLSSLIWMHVNAKQGTFPMAWNVWVPNCVQEALQAAEVDECQRLHTGRSENLCVYASIKLYLIASLAICSCSVSKQRGIAGPPQRADTRGPTPSALPLPP